MALKWDPEYLAWRSAINAPPRPVYDDPFEFRDAAHKAHTSMFASFPYPAEVERSDHTVTSADGAEIKVLRLATAAHRAAAPAPAAQESASASAPPLPPQPAVVFAFGGGLVAGSAVTWAPWVAQEVKATDVQFFVVDYRLAPENRAPGGAEDVYAALAWVSAHAASLGVDPARIAVAGASAGGCHAAGAALLARDRGLAPPLAKQVLMYPMLDDRTGARPAGAAADAEGDEARDQKSPLAPFLTWTPRNNRMGWAAYLGADKAGDPDADVSPYGAPGRVADLAGLPSTYVEVGNLDLFRDEDIDYVARLAKANVDVEFHLYPGLPHGFGAAANLAVTKNAKANLVKAYRSF
ncbi:hypothetical protein SLS62_000913 [Diatrype stigma]|uniref:Alpha/beta hydrolase fold-3 domain-containing protein n=1 Tax=Diatrype stigma TaxID=117547 RepID=A0AAN9V0R6_9PEZI